MASRSKGRRDAGQRAHRFREAKYPRLLRLRPSSGPPVVASVRPALLDPVGVSSSLRPWHHPTDYESTRGGEQTSTCRLFDDHTTLAPAASELRALRCSSPRCKISTDCSAFETREQPGEKFTYIMHPYMDRFSTCTCLGNAHIYALPTETQFSPSSPSFSFYPHR